MIPFKAIAQNQHLEDLRAEANAERLARAARQTPRTRKPVEAGQGLSFLPRLRNWPYAAR
jgi:hypothetical protein